MLKKTILRALLGFPLGICLGYIITIILSLAYGDGHYASATPELIAQFGNEAIAVLFQAILCGILGAAMAAASVIWEIDTWSIAKQTGIFFLVSVGVMFPIAYFNRWMGPSPEGFIIYAAIFVGIFIVIWLIMWFVMRLAYRKQIDQVNDKLNSNNKS